MTLNKIANGGNSLGQYQGKTIFVSHTLPGETITAQITEEQERFAHAVPVEILSASPDRMEAPCPHFYPGGCGTCHFQHARYEAQLRLKQDILIDQLIRLGGIQKPPVRAIIPARLPWGYRGQMVFYVTADGLALPAEGGERLILIDECPITSDALMETLREFNWEEDTVERIRVQQGSGPADIMIIIETADDLPPEIETDIPISINLLLSDNEPVNLIGRTYTSFRAFGRSFRSTAGVYLQPNLSMLEPLIETVLEGLALQGEETVLDLYSGVGMFTAFIAEKAGLVVSVESYPPAVTDADENLIDVENVELVEGAVENVIDDLEGPIDLVLVDPPPTGLSKRAAQGIAAVAPGRLVYVSTDPGTLARDIKFMNSKGYTLHYVQPVDMLPQTANVTAVAVMDRKKPR
jgi:23S rRNA (uracil1939-C5)-methyltransferase